DVDRVANPREQPHGHRGGNGPDVAHDGLAAALARLAHRVDRLLATSDVATRAADVDDERAHPGVVVRGAVALCDLGVVRGLAAGEKLLLRGHHAADAEQSDTGGESSGRGGAAP